MSADPSATATADPLDDPPGSSAGSSGFTGVPYHSLTPEAPKASSCRFALPTMAASAARAPAMQAASLVAGAAILASALQPAVVGTPMTSIRSLTAIRGPLPGWSSRVINVAIGQLSLRAFGLSVGWSHPVPLCKRSGGAASRSRNAAGRTTSSRADSWWPACRYGGDRQVGRSQVPPEQEEGPAALAPSVPLRVIATQWGRIGITGFGGPPAHIALLRQLCVQRRGWLSAEEFEDGIAATSLLPGPASTQLAIFCAWRLAGPLGALVGGFCFIVPGLIVILALSVLFLAHSPPGWVTGAAAGAGAAVPAVAVSAAASLTPASWQRADTVPGRARWVVYLIIGGLAANLAGEFVVAALAACGVAELLIR